MPIYEFDCPVHGRFEKIVPMGTKTAKCPAVATKVVNKPYYCNREVERIEQEVPARRDPNHGIIR